MHLALTTVAVLFAGVLTILVLVQDGRSGDLTVFHGTKTDQLQTVSSLVRGITAVVAVLLVAVLIAANVIR